MKKLFVGLALLLTLLAAGCGGVMPTGLTPSGPGVVTPKPPPTAAPQPEPAPEPGNMVGGTPHYIDPATCDAVSRRVIDQEKLTPISRCTSDVITLADGTQAHYVSINHGPGQDCPSGCFYAHKAAIVLPDRIAVLPEPFPDDREIHSRITWMMKVSIPKELQKISDRRFAEKEGKWQMILTFRDFLQGTVVVNPTQRMDTGLEIHATPTTAVTEQQARELAWPEFIRQCEPPAGARAYGGPNVSPMDDGRWAGILSWAVGEKSTKISFVVSSARQVTFDMGCGKENLH